MYISDKSITNLSNLATKNKLVCQGKLRVERIIWSCRQKPFWVEQAAPLVMGDTANDEIDDPSADGAFEIGLNQNKLTMTLMTRSNLLRNFLVVKEFCVE